MDEVLVVADEPDERTKRVVPWWPFALAAAVLLILSVALVAEVVTKNDEIATLESQVAASQRRVSSATDRAERLGGQVNDREAQRRADEAAAARIEQERIDAERKEAEDAAKEAQAQAAAAAAALAARETIPGDGLFAIGPEKNPGRYRTDGGTSCYYAVLSGPTGTGNIIDNALPGGQAFVDLADGHFFESARCGTWTRVG